jgi:AcrR family transcriptional regulator
MGTICGASAEYSSVGVIAEMDDGESENQPAPQVDGRSARSARTRDAIVDACIELVADGDLRPTGPRIAERAGVSVRSIFQHFTDLEALFSAVGKKVADRVAPHIVAIDPSLPQGERVERFCQQRAAVLEELTPIMRAARVHGPTSEVINAQFVAGHRFFRDQVDQVFAPELDASNDRVRLHHAIVVATAWGTWELLRRGQDLPIGEAQRVMAFLLESALASPLDPPTT